MPTEVLGIDALAPATVLIERHRDGSFLLRSPQTPPSPGRAVGDWLVRWAVERPYETFLAERRADAWVRLSYGDALQRVRRIAQGLIDRGLGPDRPVMVLSGNGIDHALLALAAMHVGVPVVPVSVAYSLLSRDHAKLRAIVDIVQPGLVFAADTQAFGQALAAIGMTSAPIDVLESAAPTTAVDERFAAIGPDTVAKILFTSGSTGAPKGVINTHRMLTVNQQQSLAIWRFPAWRPPVLLDWLPWNHTFGGNYNFHLVLANGGTLYIDGGKPLPGAFDTTLANLREVSPTMYFNVPRGFELLVPALEQDRALRQHFFSRCSFICYAGAALPQHLWDRLLALARQEGRDDLVIVSSWGSTETAPLCAAMHFHAAQAGIVGLPVPGVELKLIPNFGKLEARVRGPNVTPGYWRQPDVTAAAFDDDGFYRIGDALKFVDAVHPEAGLRFDGRVAEDFKLTSGTWVHVGVLRVQLLEAAEGLIQDAVITGHDRDDVGALLFLNTAVTAALDIGTVHERLRAALRRVAADNGAGGSGRIVRARILDTPPRADDGEITDKGYINQRAVLTLRADEVTRLYGPELDARDVLLATP